MTEWQRIGRQGGGVGRCCEVIDVGWRDESKRHYQAGADEVLKWGRTWNPEQAPKPRRHPTRLIFTSQADAPLLSFITASKVQTAVQHLLSFNCPPARPSRSCSTPPLSSSPLRSPRHSLRFLPLHRTLMARSCLPVGVCQMRTLWWEHVAKRSLVPRGNSTSHTPCGWQMARSSYVDTSPCANLGRKDQRGWERWSWEEGGGGGTAGRRKGERNLEG